MVEKDKWKPVELPLPTKIEKQKQYHSPGRTVEIRATIKDLKDIGVVVPTTSPLTLLSDWCRRKMDCRE